jgi:hypothetical protein
LPITSGLIPLGAVASNIRTALIGSALNTSLEHRTFNVHNVSLTQLPLRQRPEWHWESEPMTTEPCGLEPAAPGAIKATGKPGNI